MWSIVIIDKKILLYRRISKLAAKKPKIFTFRKSFKLSFGNNFFVKFGQFEYHSMGNCAQIPKNVIICTI